MAQIIPTPLSCRFAAIPGICEGEFCAYDFPACEGCPKAHLRQVARLDDPMKSVIWRGWINGIVGIKK